jgi:hypothetical protein
VQPRPLKQLQIYAVQCASWVWDRKAEERTNEGDQKVQSKTVPKWNRKLEFLSWTSIYRQQQKMQAFWATKREKSQIYGEIEEI